MISIDYMFLWLDKLEKSLDDVVRSQNIFEDIDFNDCNVGRVLLMALN